MAAGLPTPLGIFPPRSSPVTLRPAAVPPGLAPPAIRISTTQVATILIARLVFVAGYGIDFYGNLHLSRASRLCDGTFANECGFSALVGRHSRAVVCVIYGRGWP